MNAYFKGAVVAILIILGIGLWYRANVAHLIVNRAPEAYDLISKMETDGVPDFELERMDGTPFKLSQHEGKITIVNFWASWCNPCVEEFPSMKQLVEHFGDKLQIVAISTDDDKKDIQAFLKAFGLPMPGFEVVWDKNKSVMKQYGIEKVPESFLIGKDGKLIRKVLGIENWISNGAVEYFTELIAGNVDMSKIPGHSHAGMAQAQPVQEAAKASGVPASTAAAAEAAQMPSSAAPDVAAQNASTHKANVSNSAAAPPASRAQGR